jgi:hypothetical protein
MSPDGSALYQADDWLSLFAESFFYMMQIAEDSKKRSMTFVKRKNTGSWQTSFSFKFNKKI